jgi:hypothetical protein
VQKDGVSHVIHTRQDVKRASAHSAEVFDTGLDDLIVIRPLVFAPASAMIQKIAARMSNAVTGPRKNLASFSRIIMPFLNLVPVAN